MLKEEINIVDNIIQAVSILNKTEEYIEQLDDKLSEFDKLNSDFEHLIENADINNVNLKELYTKMQNLYLSRRKVKQDKSIGVYFTNNSLKLNIKTNRQMLVQGLKTVTDKLNTTYTNRILTEEDIKELIEPVKRKPGRPKKEDKNGK